MTNRTILYCDDGEERELPYRWNICPRCDGHGTSSAYLGALTREDFDDDPEFSEDYMAGRYDRPCEACDGHGKVKVADQSKMTPADRSAYQAQEADSAACDAEHRQELLMEGGWREEGWYR